jgi:hypothetical protein
MPERREANLVRAGGDPAEKPALESALFREPENPELHVRYRSLLEHLNRTTLGVSTIV